MFACPKLLTWCIWYCGSMFEIDGKKIKYVSWTSVKYLYISLKLFCGRHKTLTPIRLWQRPTHGIYVIRHEGAEPGDNPEDIGIILEGVTVIDGLPNVALAVALFLAFVYALNMCYPPEHKCTFEALQKIILEMDGNRMGTKVQALKTILSR